MLWQQADEESDPTPARKGLFIMAQCVACAVAASISFDRECYEDDDDAKSRPSCADCIDHR